MRTILLACIMLLLVPSIGLAQVERIHSFESEIEVRADGSLRVTETISVEAQGKAIRHGIYREFPTMYEGPWGLRTRVLFEVESVERNGLAEPFTIEGLGNGVRVRIGDAESVVPPGTHTYTITYGTAKQLGFFETHDELYWNVNGTGWSFPVDRIAARVRLPEGVPTDAIRTDAFTGVEGATGQDFAASVGEDGIVRFETTRGQPAGGNLTIVVGWPTGFVDASAGRTSPGDLLRANLFLVITALGVLAAWLFLHWKWIKIGRDPARGVIAPALEPPEGLSPGACRYLLKMRHDDTAYAAGLFSLAVSGVIAIIANTNDTYAIERLDPDAKPAFPDEKAIAKAVVPDEGAFEFEQKNHGTISGSLTAQESSLKNDYGHLFAHNRGVIAWAFLILFVAWVAGVLTLPVPVMMVAGFFSLWLGFWSIACLALLMGVVGSWATVVRTGKKIAFAVVISLFSLPFFAGWCFGMWMLGTQTSLWAPVALVGAAGVLLLYLFLMPAPTIEGRRLMDRIEGFSLYLRGRQPDGERAPGGIDQATFERWLPYAVALDAAEEWSAYFEEVLDSKRRAVDEREIAERDWHPVWLHGLHGGLNPSAFCDSIGSSLATAVSSSSSAPGSSSGFSGGGSSGGGGGGGGGGGW